MQPTSSFPKGSPSPHVRNITLDLILTLITCGLFNIYLQYKQLVAVNTMLGYEKYSFLHWSLLTLITCGLYHIYHEYRKTTDIMTLLRRDNAVETAMIVALTAFGLPFVADAIQQAQINRFYGSETL